MASSSETTTPIGSASETPQGNSSEGAEYELLYRVCRRERVKVGFERFCAGTSIFLQLLAQNGVAILTTGRRAPERGPRYLWAMAPVHYAERQIAVVTAAGPEPQAREMANHVALWLTDLLMLEGEVDNLAQEVVHAYEELHLLYELGTGLSGVLDVQAACKQVVDLVLAPMRAATATLTLIHQGIGEVVAEAVHPEGIGAALHPAARATVPLQVNGESIGSLILAGSLAGPEFHSGDLKLLDGVASVAAPAIYAARLYEGARVQATTDFLTGVDNHRRLQERIDEQLARARSHGCPMSIILADLDDFKLFNDLYGHPVGDRVLQTVSDCMRESVRRNDIVGRYGGDEFLIILPDTSGEDALQVAGRLLESILRCEIAVNDERLPLGVSLGIASFPQDGATKHELIAHADGALYESKRSGGRTLRQAHAARSDWLALHGNTFGVLEGLIRSVDAKDHYTHEHSDIVTEAALLLAQQLNLSEETRRALRIAGLLHDVGKIGIPDHVLKKPGKLTPEEYAIMQQHVQLSEMMIKNVPYLTDVLDAVGHHHERFDGTGYPYGKREEQIPLLGRIMALADAYSAMCLDRPYRKGMSWAEIRAELERGSGTQFDPDLVPIFIAAMDGHLAREGALQGQADRRGQQHVAESPNAGG